jgi:cytochrome c biogenesis protein ResB
VILKAWERLVAFLASASLAIALLVFVGVWSFLATLVPQDASSSPHDLAAWADSHSAIEPVVRLLGMHAAFGSPVFLVCTVVLALSTAICAWKRTKVAWRRDRRLLDLARLDRARLISTPEHTVPIDPERTDAEIFSAIEGVFAELGLPMRRRGDTLRRVSPRWGVWGSAVFHWALVLLMLTVLGGRLVRSEGSIDLAVGEAKPNVATSYADFHAGPLYRWSPQPPIVRLDRLEPDYRTGGVDRGAVPTVSLLDATGHVLVSQRVYENNMLHSGPLSINAPGLGLAAVLAFSDSSGRALGQRVEYIDFSQDTSGGTVPVSEFSRRDASGKVIMRMFVTVPLEGTPGHYGEWIPRPPRARILVTSAAGTTLVDRLVSPGDSVQIPGAEIRLAGINWYSRLSLVDDPSIPFIYAAMVIAALGLAMTVTFRQAGVAVAIEREPSGAKVALSMSLWRNVPTNREEVLAEIGRALSASTKEMG